MRRAIAENQGAGVSPAPILDEAATVAGRTAIRADTVELSLRSPRIAAAARPGQFVDVLLPGPGFGYRVAEGEEAWRDLPRLRRPFLIRRPFSIYRAHASDRGADRDTIDLLVKVVGVGTRALAQLEVGAGVKVLGPLGNGFSLPPAGAPAALVAGGCGWASLAMLARELRRRGHPTYAFIGAATVEALPVATCEAKARPALFRDELPEACVTSDELESLGVTVALAAEAGGRVYGGLVTDLLEKFLRGEHGRGAHVYACGPWGMLRRVADLAERSGAPCQVALEERMGCGIGVCNSCVVEVFLPSGEVGHKKLCADGPVLDAAEVNWDQNRG